VPSLPAWSNQSNVNTLTGAVSEENAKRKVRIKLKRRTRDQSSLNSGLIGYYKFNETTITGGQLAVIDQSLKGNHGSYYNQASIGVGFIGNGLFLPNNDSVTTASRVNTFIKVDRNYSMNGWMYINSITGTARRCFLGGTGNVASSTNDGRFSCGVLVGGAPSTATYIIGAGDSYNPTYSQAGSIQGWHMYTLNLGSGTAFLYKDGVSVDSITSGLSFTAFSSSGYFFIGNVHSDTQGPSITVDEVAIWNRSLTQAEITQLYNSGSGYEMNPRDKYDSDFTTITNDLISINDLESGVDDQNYLVGQTRISNVEILLNNSTRKYNPRQDSLASLWADPSISYYIHNSMIDIDLGYELQTGTTFYDTKMYGLIKGETIEYDNDNHIAKMSIVSRSDYLKSIYLYEIFSITNSQIGYSKSIIDSIFTYLKNNLPTEFSITIQANQQQENVIIENFANNNSNVYDLLEDFARQGGSYFVFNNLNQLYITYPGANFIGTQGTFTEETSITNGLYLFKEPSQGGAVLDYSSTTATYNLSITGVLSLTPGRFGYGRLFYNSSTAATNSLAANSSITGQSLEVLCRFNKFKEWPTMSAQIRLHDGSGINPSPEFFRLGGSTLEESGRGYRVTFGTLTNLNTINKKLPIPENQWVYYAYTFDVVNDIKNFYINGSLFFSDTGTNGAYGQGLFLGTKENNWEVDSIRISNETKSANSIAAMADRIFGANIDLTASKTVTHDFYNYGSKNNIININSYTDGQERSINIVKSELFNQIEYELSFWADLTSTSGTITIYDVDSTKIPSVSANNSLTTFINKSYSNMTASVTGNKFVITMINPVENQINFNGISFNASLPVNFSYSSLYLNSSVGGAVVLGFIRKNPLINYQLINTSSNYEYGPKEMTIKQNNMIINDISQTAILMQNILDQYTTPKIRMGLRTRFLEGNLDLLDKVTVHWSSDLQGNDNDTTRDGDDAGSGFANIAGRITWEWDTTTSSRDFWVIGQTHSYENAYTDLILREI